MKRTRNSLMRTSSGPCSTPRSSSSTSDDSAALLSERRRPSMQRLLLLAVLALMVLAAGLAAAAEPSGKSAPQKPKSGAETEKVPVHFDAAEFLKDHDRDKDGYLSRDELPKRFRHNFDRIDANKDGKLSVQELQKGEAYLQPRRRPSDVVLILVEMSDADEDCAEEVQRVYELVRQLDRNKDGKIDTDELRAGREAVIKERVDTIFEELDRNKDGKISRDEARGQIRRYFD